MTWFSAFDSLTASAVYGSAVGLHRQRDARQNDRVHTFRTTLPVVPRRILVAGVTGVGKTTFCRAIAASTAVPHIEIDALFHGEGWVVRPDFVADVAALSATAAWVTEWQ